MSIKLRTSRLPTLLAVLLVLAPFCAFAQTSAGSHPTAVPPTKAPTRPLPATPLPNGQMTYSAVPAGANTATSAPAGSASFFTDAANLPIVLGAGIILLVGIGWFVLRPKKKEAVAPEFENTLP